MQILVMNDGLTWGSVDGAYIIDITEEQHDALCEGDDAGMLWARCSDHANGEFEGRELEREMERSYISITDLLARCRLGTWEPENE